MSELIPKPSKFNCLSRLCSLIDFSEILDVGVNEQTRELKTIFPQLKHHLFEPIPSFREPIERNYAGVEKVIYPIALSNESGAFYLTITSLMSDGVATHSQLVAQQSEVDGASVLSCERIEARRFDELELKVPANFLLKVDVDGKDLQVLEGFGTQLRFAAAIVIEATFNTFQERLAYCLSRGFQLFDIVDLVYYGPSLYQCDLVFVRSDLISESLRPPIQKFQRNLWMPLQVSS